MAHRRLKPGEQGVKNAPRKVIAPFDPYEELGRPAWEEGYEERQRALRERQAEERAA